MTAYKNGTLTFSWFFCRTDLWLLCFFFRAQCCLHFVCLTNWTSYENLESLLCVSCVILVLPVLEGEMKLVSLSSRCTQCTFSQFEPLFRCWSLAHSITNLHPPYFPCIFFFSLPMFLLQYLCTSSVTHACFSLHSCSLNFSSCCSASVKLSFKYSFVPYMVFVQLVLRTDGCCDRKSPRRDQ